jgi:hypothetical protein
MTVDTTSVAGEAELLRSYLADRDVACPQCKYNLRNLVGTTCPECGEALRLRVSSVEPRQAASLAGLIVLAAGTGLNALLLIYVIIVIMQRNGGPGWMSKFVVVNAVELLVMAPCLAVWLWHWKKIRKLGTVRRWALVASCAALTLADVIVFAKMIR